MKKLLVVALPLLLWSRLCAADAPGQIVFQDDFNRSTPQSKTDSPGNGWSTNSRARAKGQRQVELRDGAMYIFISPEADHPVSVVHTAAFTNGTLSLRFKLEDKRDSLGVDFADPQCKEVHAGHLFAVRVFPTKVLLQDLKTGAMRLDIQTARQQKQALTAEQQQALKGKQKSVPCPVAVGAWHELVVTVAGDVLSATVDGKSVGALQSPGIGHPTKRVLRLAVPRNAVVDDVKLWRSE